MSVLSIGDLAATFLIRRQSTQLKADLTRLGQELTTGRRQEIGRSLAGDFGPIAAIERSLATLSAYKTANTETAGMLAAAQLALGNVQSMQQDLGPALLTAATAQDATLIGATAEDARQKFAAVISSLNMSVADKTMFGGAATDRPPLADADNMMDHLKSAVAAETTAAGVIVAVNTWFDDPAGGFQTLGYLGATSDIGPFSVADGETAEISIRADDPVIRGTLKSFALAGLIAEGVLPGLVEEQAGLMAEAAQGMLTDDGAVTDLRARLGAVEARVDGAQARNAAEAAAHELARVELIGVDPYEAATELEAVYAKIETLYTVTARIAGLRFTDFMK